MRLAQSQPSRFECGGDSGPAPYSGGPSWRSPMRAPSMLVLAACLLAPPAMAADDVQVMIVGGFHMSGGHDMHNVQVDDVLAPKRQAEIQAVVDGIAQFKPTMVDAEW